MALRSVRPEDGQKKNVCHITRQFLGDIFLEIFLEWRESYEKLDAQKEVLKKSHRNELTDDMLSIIDDLDEIMSFMADFF